MLSFVSVTVFVKVITSPDLAILRPVPAPISTKSVVAPAAPLPVSTIFSLLVFVPSAADTA